MDTKLNCGERLIILNVMPKEGNFITLRMIRNLVQKLGLTAEEIVNFQVEEAPGGQVRWGPMGAIEKEFEFAQAEVDLIKKQLKKMDDDGKLTNDTFTVYEKFCM
jgi:hypothetical protein